MPSTTSLMLRALLGASRSTHRSRCSLAGAPRPISPHPLFGMAVKGRQESPGWSVPLIDREAIEQAVAAGAAEIGLAAAAVGAAGGMRGVPRLRRVVVAQAFSVGVADHRGTLGAARPVVAAPVVTRRKRLAVGLRAGQRIVPVGGVADAIDDIALFGEGRLLGQVVGAMELVDVFGDGDTLAVLPWSTADAVAGIDRRLP